VYTSTFENWTYYSRVYNSTIPRELGVSVKGLLVLCSILNDDVKESCYVSFEDSFEKCGWANPFKDCHLDTTPAAHHSRVYA
jgi:hypothetical protein